MAEGRFRADLYFRIRMIHLSIPALRERGADISLLADHYLALHARRYGKEGLTLSADARRALLQHRWPGNVRELRNVIEQAVLMSSGPVVESLDLDWLPASAGVSPAGSGAVVVADTRTGGTRRAAANARNSRWNVSHAARLLGISRDALRYRIEKYALAVPD